MRYSALVLAATAALAEELHTTVLTIGYTNSVGSAVTAVTTYVYDYANPVTSLLTQTNSEGIITGNAATHLVTSQPPLVTSQPAVETSQPAVATIPAGLAEGTYTIVLPQGTGTGLTSFTVSVGTSTTSVLTPVKSTTTSAGAAGTGNPSGTGSGSDASGTVGTAGSSPTPTGNAAVAQAPISVGLVFLGSVLAALF